MQVSVSEQLPEEVPVDPKEVDLAPHPVVGLVLQIGDTEKIPQALGFESLDPFFFQSQQAWSMVHSCREG